MRHISFFSQSGSEIQEIASTLGRYPDVIVTNKPFSDIEKINPDLLANAYDRFIFVGAKPTVEEYETIINEGDMVTLHGWLRVIPAEVCNKFQIYNGHPGDIVTYPVLKGKDPQKKAVDLQLKSSGCVIHKVTSVVDDGDVLLQKNVNIDGMELDDVTKLLHFISVDLWVEFLSINYSQPELH